MAISEETRLMIKMLDEFGALTVAQINKIFEGSKTRPAPMMAYLRNERITQYLDDNYVVKESKQEYTPEKLYCVWVLLDKIKEQCIASSQSLKTATGKNDQGIEVGFINDKRCLEYITFVDSTSISKVSLIQDTFYTKYGVVHGEEKNARTNYTFVVKDEDTMEMLSKMELTIPFMVAYVEGDLIGIPSIEYYEA